MGAVSLDRLQLASGERVAAAGGAGLYTALAAAAAGIRVRLYAPRPAPPLPAPLEELARRVEWLGPEVAADQLPRLEIAHHGAGRATLLAASWGAAQLLAPEQLPSWGAPGWVHVAALPSPSQQLGFAREVRRRRGARLSAGSYARAIEADADSVRGLLGECDVFFMNANEARLLFGEAGPPRPSPGRLLYVTRGRDGVGVCTPDGVRDVAARPATERDPTGAGDSLCGAVLARLLAGADPVAAAEAGVEIAARVVEAVGPAALLRDPARD